MRTSGIFLIVILFSLCFEQANAQNISNEGSEFWAVFPTHVPNPGSDATMNINVTSKFNTSVTVSCGNTTETKSVPANKVVTFLVNRPQSYVGLLDGNKNLVNRGIHIEVAPGMPKIVVYAHVFASARSAATLVLPVEALGQKYYSMNYTQDNQGENFLAVIATEDNTDLILHKTDGTTLSINGLNKGDVYEYIVSPDDLTGTFVETAENSACKRFAAFSGSSALRIGGNSGGIDPLLQQLYSINSWGKKYGVIPFINRRYIVRVVAQEDNTNVYFDGVVSGVINKGKFLEKVLSVPTIISSEKLISVAEYSYTQEFSSITGKVIGTGDPEMVLLNPIEFNIKNITLFSSDKLLILEKFLNVFMKTNKISTFKINGQLPTNGSWKPMPQDPSYSYIQTQVIDESLTLSADDGFNAIAYGFGVHESYSYSAGTSLATNQFLTLLNKTTSIESPTACLGQPSDLKITLPYKLDRLVWSYGDGTSDDEINNPAFVRSGPELALYTYTSPVSKTFTTVGPTTINAIATAGATLLSCFNSEIPITFNFDVDPLPTAEITAPSTFCMNVDLPFSGMASRSNVSDKVIKIYNWDFGDGEILMGDFPEPKHAYLKSGTYTVKLFVSAENGCFSDVITKEIFINPKPEALFQPDNSTCVGRSISFTDKSSTPLGRVVKWNWNFGDPTSSSNTSIDKNPSHLFEKIGRYIVTLTVETDNGCSETFSMPVIVNPVPKVDFQTPDFCLNDAQAVFTNRSTDFDGITETGLTYLWDFGDVASGALNTSTDKDGKHIYTVVGNYTITLTVKNSNGCVAVSAPRIFTVNGSNPKAEFLVVDDNKLCSDNEIRIINKASVDFGKITKVEWYVDGVKYGDDLDPVIDKEYSFSFPKFSSPVSKIVTIKMVVYSGGTCSSTIEKSLTLKASAAIEFDPLAPICLNAGQLQLNGRQISTLIGGGKYLGIGVIDNDRGIFDPKVAGVGKHEITYLFTADNGCSVKEIQFIEVFPIPKIYAGRDEYVLLGGEKQLQATATGVGLTYKWTPSVGLSRDDILNPIARPENDVLYTLTITSSQGCVVNDQVFVHVLSKVVAPNSFTPNGDGINDVWNVQYLDSYPKVSVEIYNRNGQRIYFSRGYAQPFDGNFNNQPLPVGTYYYIINPNSGTKSITGDLTIIR